MSNISIIVAAAEDHAIGQNGDLIWHISADLRRFKALTTGHTIIMGRKTWESLPNGALPNRRNIVISRNPQFSPLNAEVYASIDSALEACQGEDEIFIIGGAQIYRQTIDKASRIYLTRVYATYPQADAHFPQIDTRAWNIESQQEEMTNPDGTKYQFIDLIRNK